MDNRKNNGSNLSQADRSKGGKESHKNDATRKTDDRERDQQDGRRS